MVDGLPVYPRALQDDDGAALLGEPGTQGQELAYVVPKSRHAVWIVPSSLTRRRHAVSCVGWPSIPQHTGCMTCLTLISWRGEMIMVGTSVLRL